VSNCCKTAVIKASSGVAVYYRAVNKFYIVNTAIYVGAYGAFFDGDRIIVRTVNSSANLP
jgi:hypothetical protein